MISDGWYFSRNKHSKYSHFFHKGTSICGWRCNPDIPLDTAVEPCPKCQYWLNRVHYIQPLSS